MSGWNNKNCCCEPKPVSCRDGDVPICCMTLHKSGWAKTVSVYAINHTPDDICGYDLYNPYHNNNTCGLVQLWNGCLAEHAEIRWGIVADGTVTLTYSNFPYFDSRGVFVQQVSYSVTGLDPETWYLSPIVFTVSGITYTINVCSDPHTPFPPWPRSQIFLKATSRSREGRSVGDLLCGADCDPLRSSVYTEGPKVGWNYLIYTDEIRISVGGFNFPYCHGSITVPYDDGGWAEDTHVIPLLCTDGTDASATVSPTDSCDIPPPPPPCGPYSYFPECLVKECDGVVGAYALFYTVSTPGGCCIDSTGQFTWDGWSYYSGKIGDPFLVACGYIEIWYEGYTPGLTPVFRRRTRITQTSGIWAEYTQDNPGTCETNPENFVDTFNLIAGLFGCMAPTVDVFTNN